MAPLSEYRRKYKQKGEASQKDYVVRYNYMLGRRSTEMSHTPLDWDVSDTESEISSSRSDVALHNAVNNNNGPNNTVASKPSEKGQIIEKHLTRPRSKGKQVKKHTLMKNVTTSTEKMKHNDVGVQVNQVKSVTSSQNIKSQEESQTPKSKKSEYHPTSREANANVKVVKDGRGKSSVSKKASKSCPGEEVRAPLIPYGWAYRGPIDNHKTFNVKVPEQEACQSALRAMKHRQLEAKKREEDKKYQEKLKRKTEALFDFVEKDKSGWMSEYQRNFSGHTYRY